MNSYAYIYFLAGFFVLAESSQADVVWSGERNLSGFSQYVDLNSDSLIDVAINYNFFGTDESEVGRIDAVVDGLSVNGSNRIMVESLNGIAAALPYGTLISGTSISSYEWKGGISASGKVSSWIVYNPDYPGPPLESDEEWQGLLGENGNTFIGIEFDVEGATHYGWVNIALGSEAFHHDFMDPLVTSWAYESAPGTPIAAGAIPEPSTAILTLVGSVSLILCARARRRNR